MGSEAASVSWPLDRLEVRPETVERRDRASEGFLSMMAMTVVTSTKTVGLEERAADRMLLVAGHHLAAFYDRVGGMRLDQSTALHVDKKWLPHEEMLLG
jgi:hypothetical protein